MAVLVEAISVIVRNDSVRRSFEGGWEGFLRTIPNRSFCADDSVARVGFMSPADVDAYVSVLEAGGLVFRRDGLAVDFAVVDQMYGPTVEAPWLTYSKVVVDDMAVSACWLTGEQFMDLSVPDGWDFSSSLSHAPGFVPNAEVDERMTFLRREGGVDVYRDERSGKEMFVGRPVLEGDTRPVLFTRLEAACHEVLRADAQSESLEASGDQDSVARVRRKIEDEVLPSVAGIAEGAGSQMAFSHFALGLTLRVLGRREEALRAFLKANELQQGVPNTLLEVVRCLGELGRADEALPFARTATEADPASAAVWGNLAACLYEIGEFDEARVAIDRAIPLDPHDSVNLSLRDRIDRRA